MNNNETVERSGFVALVGRPNCGKSTLMNTVIGEELAVVTPLPQTTRKNLKGIYTDKKMQIIFTDTPGIHSGHYRFNKSMVEESAGLLRKHNADVVCYIVDTSRNLGNEEDMIVRMVKESGIPVIIIFNKEDICRSIESFRQEFFKHYPDMSIYANFSISAVSKKAKDIFINSIKSFLPEGPVLFPPDDLTDAGMRFFASEYIRKHIINNTKDEVPHAVFVEILSYRETESKHYIDAEIHVETDGQKAIVIGKKGMLIKKIQMDAGKDLEKISGVPAVIMCHVKISRNWRSNDGFLREMGFSVR
jgi:GTPase